MASGKHDLQLWKEDFKRLLEDRSSSSTSPQDLTSSFSAACSSLIKAGHYRHSSDLNAKKHLQSFGKLQNSDYHCLDGKVVTVMDRLTMLFAWMSPIRPAQLSWVSHFLARASWAFRSPSSWSIDSGDAPLGQFTMEATVPCFSTCSRSSTKSIKLILDCLQLFCWAQ